MLEEFAPSLYVADGPTVPFLTIPYPTRMAIARPDGGSAWVAGGYSNPQVTWYDAQGNVLLDLPGFSADQKYVAFLSE